MINRNGKSIKAFHQVKAFRYNSWPVLKMISIGFIFFGEKERKEQKRRELMSILDLVAHTKGKFPVLAYYL